MIGGQTPVLSRRERLLTMAFAGVGHFFSHLFFAAYAMVVVDLAVRGAFGLGYDDLLPLMGVGLFLYGIGAVPAGILGDRWSAPGMLVIFLIGTGIVAWATGYAQNGTMLWLGLSALGLVSSIYHPVGIAWLTRDSTGRGWMLGVNGMVGNLAIGCSPLIAGVLIDFYSWRTVFILPGILCLLTGLAMAWAWWRGIFTGGNHLAATARNEAEPTEMRRGLLVLAIVVLCAGVVFNALIAVLPQFVADSVPGLIEGGMTRLGLVVAPLYLLGAASQLLSGWLSDRLPVKPIYVSCWILQILAFGLLVFLVGPVALPVALVALSCALASLTPENVMLARFSPPAWRSTIYGLKFIVAFGIGWPAVEIAGWLYGERQSFDLLFLILAGFAVLASFAALALPGSPRGLGRARFA